MARYARAEEGINILESVIARQCAWKSCEASAEPRKGPRGPHPAHCLEHAKARKRVLDGRPRGRREPYQVCCVQWQEAGNRGLCPQHRDNRKAWRLTEVPARPGVRRQFDDEAAWLAEMFTPAGRFHVDQLPAGFNSVRGPWEGRTVAPNGDWSGQVFNADPFEDAEASEWYEANKDWYRAEKFLLW